MVGESSCIAVNNRKKLLANLFSFWVISHHELLLFIGRSFVRSFVRSFHHTNQPTNSKQNSLSLPEGIIDLPEGVTVDDANSIKDNFVDGSLTATETIALLDFLVERVYESSPSKETDRYACDVSGLTKLSCDYSPTKKARLRPDGEPVRSVTLPGLLVEDDLPWASDGGDNDNDNNGIIAYTPKDFLQMSEMGLNTVQIAVPVSVLLLPGTDSKRGVLDRALSDLKDAGLEAILELVAASPSEADPESIASAASSAASGEHSETILAVTLPEQAKITTEALLGVVRSKVGPDPALMIPLALGGFMGPRAGDSEIDDPRVYGSLSWPQVSTVAEIASSTSTDDRNKLSYHESMACEMRSPIEHGECFGSRLPIFVSYGFDLSIDDCASKNDNDGFRDYGQCDRFEETKDSGWWQRHRSSFAARQISSAERGLGWSFTAWKLSDDDNAAGSGAVLDEPAKLLALREVAGAGIFPDLTASDAAAMACLNPPDGDYIMGDDTLSPTAGPPPDCGNGWWNADTAQCKCNDRERKCACVSERLLTT